MQVDLGLVIQLQLIGIDGIVQFVGKLQALDSVAVMLRVVHGAASVGAFGDIHRGVGMLYQGLRAVTVLRVHSDAETGADMQEMVVQIEHAIERDVYLLCHMTGKGLVCIRNQNGEFVTAQTGNSVGVTQDLLQASADLL